MRSPSELRSRSVRSTTSCATLVGGGASGWRRANASSCWVRRAPRSAAVLGLLERDLDPARRAPGDQIEGFLGAGLPPGSRLWSKAGWTSTLRHDAALVTLPGGARFRLVVLTEGRAASADARALPALAAAIARDLGPR